MAWACCVYVILWIIMPEVGREDATPGQTIESNVQEVANKAQEFAQNVGQAVQSGPNRQAGILVGAALIVLGVVFTPGYISHSGLVQVLTSCGRSS